MLPSTKTSIYFRPSRSGKGQQSSKFGPMLRAAELPCRLQPLLSRTPNSGACSSCFISLSCDPGFSGPLGTGLLPLQRPYFPFPLFYCLQDFLLPQVPSHSDLLPNPQPLLPSQRFFLSCGLPTLCFPPFLPQTPSTRPLPAQQLYPNLFFFSSASPHHEFPLSVPRFPVSSPPTAPRVPGA